MISRRECLPGEEKSPLVIERFSMVGDLKNAARFSRGMCQRGDSELFSAWMWVPPSFLWTWCHGWVGWRTKFFHVPPSARGIVCWTGWVSLALMSLTCPQAHGDETAGAALSKCCLGRYLVSLA